MNVVDVIIIALLILGGVAGFKAGVIKKITDFIGMFVVIILAFYLKNYVKNIYGWSGSEEDKPRELLQKIGIDLIKNKIDSNLLIRRVCEDIKVYSYFYDIIIITDARLKDEIEIPKRLFNNVVTIRIDSIYYDKKMTIEQMNHITETNLDNYNKFDYVINDFDKLEEILSKI